ncbi:serine/threonine protein kinase [Streptomyces mangrovisoli]|uniref:non-specific serine/threonine protein kinase n=1 Tax=Streptomyces mangrovisoli TaxID=1428628 RepID=A0A1J4NVM0_9ACTN|nr:serine/threonine-protein kinase [Streptomyces mangrovisoli]OIJ66545.1 serine/threonine protein kinase [Streptomyces mangrovisoli]
MVKGQATAVESVAGRYRPVEVVHRETNRVVWYAEDLHAARPRLLTRIDLPDGSGRNTAQRTTAHVVRTHEILGVLRPGRVAVVVDAVEEGGTLWTVTEWIDGVPLGELLERQGAFTPERAARVGLELLEVLEAAHGEGITHGELSPGQIYLRDEGPVVVTGFGLAGATLVPRVAAPSYASPEQARDERIGPAADLWALGAILYTMVEGRPPFRDRGRPEATLRAVDRLPLRAPLRAGPLSRTVQGLLRKDSRERLTRTAVREALTRVLAEAQEEPDGREDVGPGVHASAAVRLAGSRGGRALAAGTALATVTVAFAVLAATHELPDSGVSSASGTTGHPASATAAGAGETADGHATAVPSPTRTAAPTPTASRSASPSAPASASPSASATTAVPLGFRRYTAPEGFAVDIPEDWTRLRTQRSADGAYRVTFGASGDDRTLAVTFSQQVGPDPVAVWRDDVLPNLRQTRGFALIGTIRATTYQGHKAADMQWFEGVGLSRTRTFGRGFLLTGTRGFSLRWTVPALDLHALRDARALKTVLASFRPSA